jgi:hypothetical protein
MEHIFFFKPEQIQEFQYILHDYSDRSIEKFVMAIDAYCYELSRIKTLPGANRKRSLRDRQKDILADIEQTLSHLRAYGEEHEQGAGPESIEDAIYPGDRYTPEAELKPYAEANLFLKAAAWKAIPSLAAFRDELAATIEYNEQDRGRPSPIAGEVVEEIAWFYDMYLDEPTMYAEGLFADVVTFILEAVDLPSRAPTRQIRAALIKHRNKHLTIKNR